MNRIHFPSYRLTIEDVTKLVPPIGVYAVSIPYENELLKGMLNIRPGTDSLIPRVDVHLFNEPENLHHKTVNVCFHKRIRNELDFSSHDALQKQLEQDRQEIEDLIY